MLCKADSEITAEKAAERNRMNTELFCGLGKCDAVHIMIGDVFKCFKGLFIKAALFRNEIAFIKKFGA